MNQAQIQAFASLRHTMETTPGIRHARLQLERAEAKVRKALDAYEALRAGSALLNTPEIQRTALLHSTETQLDAALRQLGARTDALERLHARLSAGEGSALATPIDSRESPSSLM